MARRAESRKTGQARAFYVGLILDGHPRRVRPPGEIVDSPCRPWYHKEMEIDKGKLLDLLNSRSKYIRGHMDTVLAGLAMLSFIISVILSGIGSSGIVTKVLVGLTATGYAAVFAWSILHNRYSIETLFREICACNNDHRFTLAVLKDKGRFLLKYDRRWRTWLFPYTKADTDSSVLDFVRYGTGLAPSGIVRQEETDVTKHSVSAGMTKTYHHTFCEVAFTGDTSRRKFRFAGEKYKWFSIGDMKLDRRIMDTNSETVDFVERHFQ